MTDSHDPVVLEVVDKGIATLTLNRPHAMNALNEALINQLEEKFLKAEDNTAVKAIVIRGAGNQFVAGADINFFIDKIQRYKLNDVLSFTRKTSELFLAIENSKKITIAVLDGLSLGGGSELALSCQAIVATDKGSMAFPETAIGIYPGLGGMLRLARKIGSGLAKYYVYTGETISALYAFDFGLVNAIVPLGELDQGIDNVIRSGIEKTKKPLILSARHRELADLFSSAYLIDQIERNDYDVFSGSLSQKNIETEKIIKILRKKAPLALKTANTIIDLQMGKSMKEAIEIELDHLIEMFATQDALEGLSSAGKRKPNYKGI